MHDLTLTELQIMLSMFEHTAQTRGALTVTEQDVYERLRNARQTRLELEDLDLMSACEGCLS